MGDVAVEDENKQENKAEKYGRIFTLSQWQQQNIKHTQK